jgi:hypothetical protein
MEMTCSSETSSGFLTTTAWLGLAQGTGGFHIRRIAVIVLNKQSRTALKGWSSKMVGKEQESLAVNKLTFYEK